jgi:hypothetical protein
MLARLDDLAEIEHVTYVTAGLESNRAHKNLQAGVSCSKAASDDASSGTPWMDTVNASRKTRRELRNLQRR